MNIPKNIKELELVDGACNASGVVHSLANIFTELRESGVKDTNELNNHPIVRYYLIKLASLAGINTTFDDYHKTYEGCVEYFIKELRNEKIP